MQNSSQVDRALRCFSSIPAILFSALVLLVQNGIGQNPGNIAPGDADTGSRRSMQVHRISEAPRIDGAIDAVWTSADSVTNFTQHAPFYGVPPSYRTTAKLLSTDEALYCLIVCEDPSGEIQQQSGMLDNYAGDFVSIMLDTFGDRKSAYKLIVSAAGVRGDARLLDDARNRDYSWDGVWFSDAQVYPWGYVVEMEIPYRSIQYDENLESWGLDFDRWISTKTEDIYWSPYEESEGIRVSKFGELRFDGFRPSAQGFNFEIYPVGIVKADYIRDGVYDISPTAGLDMFYNPSPSLTFQLTGNPDFAQIEADPYEFNISRYESYFEERRPFFTEGKEIFMASGRQQDMGFYRPLELFYSRRIGRKLADGQEVPLYIGSKAFGRFGGWEYGGFVAQTGEVAYTDDGERKTEERATFASGRMKSRLFDNSDLGVLFVGKWTPTGDNGVIDLDGALRGSDWQLAYQVARSFRSGEGDYAASAGFTMPTEKWLAMVRARAVGKNFDIDDVGFVPWKGTAEIVAMAGPRWYYNEGAVRQILFYIGGIANYEDVDLYTDLGVAGGYNMNFRSNWGGEINFLIARSKDEEKEYTSSEINFSTWFHTDPLWEGNIWGAYSRTYNFNRNWASFYSQLGAWLAWHTTDEVYVSLNAGMFIEGNPDNDIEDITWNARPAINWTPWNDVNLRLYVDNLFVRSSDRMEQVIAGFLFSWNFKPKSWIYFAINDVRDRSEQYDGIGMPLPVRMHVVGQAAVLKVKYLYYF
ncbi:MAG: carbohydrate binding family 9 domain-containing protein [Bacteroidetes bacterium]|nr:carbohydrate binding family 9 domain-containing protein [Bacteroidota bacterium]